jgi:cytochrome oxidase Cu insertion factor (SCO1/SenC/PrrC family)
MMTPVRTIWMSAVLFAVGYIQGVPALFAADPAQQRLDHLFGGPFELTSPDHVRVSDRSLRGKFLLITFGYTHCPDICPTGLAIVGEAIDELGDQGKSVQPIFITVDPDRDTPEKLKEYGKSFHQRYLMLTGSEQEIAAVAKAYRVHRRKYAFADTANTRADYGVDHGSLMYLIGPDGSFRTIFPYGTTVEQLTTSLKSYVAAQ